MAALRGANLALKFGLELAAIASLGYWGASLDGSVLSAVAMVLAPAALIGLWARFAAPRAPRRLPLRKRVPLELTLLLLASAALLAADQGVLAAVMAAVVVLNALLLTAFGQWEA